jgi:hypothetical protein
MFQVEYNAAEKAKKRAEEMRAKGMSAKEARRAARKQEANDVKRGNAWIRENVGLN